MNFIDSVAFPEFVIKHLVLSVPWELRGFFFFFFNPDSSRFKNSRQCFKKTVNLKQSNTGNRCMSDI